MSSIPLLLKLLNAPRRLSCVLLLAAACPALASCGPVSAAVAPDGGDGPPTEAPDAGEAAATEWPEEWAALEEALVDLVNEMRATGGSCPSGPQDPAPPLVVDDRLTAAARGHALDMGERGYFAHDSLDGRTPWDRIDDAGYTGSARAENIAAGRPSAEETFEQWRTSDGHCRNMMSPSANEIGVGYAVVEGSPYRHYWVQNFGYR